MSARATRRLARPLVDGSVASVLSTLVTIAESVRAAGHPGAATNGASQWIWGTRAQRRRKASWRYTAVGYLIHHASSLLWASAYESAFARRVIRRRGMRAVAVAALAATVDYLVVPRRFTPGFEGQMTRPAIVATYVAFAAGLVLGSSLRPARAEIRDRSRSVRAHARPVR